MVIRDLYCNQLCAPLKCVSDYANVLLYFRVNIKLSSWTDCWKWYFLLASNGQAVSIVERWFKNLLLLNCLLWSLTWSTRVAGISTHWLSNMYWFKPWKKISGLQQTLPALEKSFQVLLRKLMQDKHFLPSNNCFKEMWFSQLYTKRSAVQMDKIQTYKIQI